MKELCPYTVRRTLRQKKKPLTKRKLWEIEDRIDALKEVTEWDDDSTWAEDELELWIEVLEISLRLTRKKEWKLIPGGRHPFFPSNPTATLAVVS